MFAPHTTIMPAPFAGFLPVYVAADGAITHLSDRLPHTSPDAAEIAQEAAWVFGVSYCGPHPGYSTAHRTREATR